MNVNVDPRELGVMWALILLALLLFWCAWTGRLGAFLGALISPGQMQDVDLSGGGAPENPPAAPTS